MQNEFETWSEINDRHALEKAEAMASLRDAGLTQTQAAQKLGIPLGHLNSFIARNGIPWTPAKQGKSQ
jgi:transcriptional regulator with GAF, ATPase, and Fis domain